MPECENRRPGAAPGAAHRCEGHPLKNILALLAATVLAPTAFAGRPLATDDASVADAGTCQVEAWTEQTRDAHAVVAVPACGLPGGLEIGVDLTRLRTHGMTTTAAGITVKWVPEGGNFESPLGRLSVGLSVASGTVRQPGGEWDTSAHNVFAIATLQPMPSLLMHLNVGAARDARLHMSATLVNAALEWSAAERAVLFAEVLANDRASAFGTAQRGAGARWWLVKDRIGLDLTASRQAGAANATRFTVGIGWYGLSR